MVIAKKKSKQKNREIGCVALTTQTLGFEG